jgi:hypothetical protein
MGLAIEINDDGAALAYGNCKDARIIYSRHYSAEVSDGLMDAEEFKEIVADFVKRHKIGTKKICMTIKTSDFILKHARFPAITARELRQAAMYSMPRYIPDVLIARYIIDYKIIAPVTNKLFWLRPKPAEIIYTGVPESLAERYADAAEELGMPLAHLAFYQDCAAEYVLNIAEAHKGKAGVFALFAPYMPKTGPIINFLLIEGQEIRQWFNFAHSSAEVCADDIDSYMKYGGLRIDEVYVLDGPEWLAEYFNARGAEVTMLETKYEILKILLKRGFK